MGKDYRLADLERMTGVPTRTIRYYIAKNILRGPRQAGRNAVYGKEHIDRLNEIGRLKSEGKTLAEVALALREPAHAAEPIDARQCTVYRVAPDVMVTVDANVSPWRARRIRHLIDEMSQHLNQTENEEK
jgi:DNA-binding transcriptional MerR regulator